MVSMDNQVKQQGEARGVGSNPGLLIDSYEMKGKDGYIVYDNAYDTRAEVGFIGGEAIRVDGPGKEIISTPWLKAGTIRDNMIMILSFETSTLPGGTTIATGTKILEGRIFKRNPKTKEVEKTVELGFANRTTTNKNPGSLQVGTTNDSYATEFFNFTPQHEYKFVIKTSQNIENTQSIIMDYIYFEYVPNQSWTHPRQLAFVGSEASDVGGIPGIPIMEAFWTSISLNGSGDGSVTCRSYTTSTYVTSYQEYNYFFGTYNSIYGTFYSPTADNGSFSWNINAIPSTVGPGYQVTIVVNTNFGGGTLYGCCLLVGYNGANQI